MPCIIIILVVAIVYNVEDISLIRVILTFLFLGLLTLANISPRDISSILACVGAGLFLFPFSLTSLCLFSLKSFEDNQLVG